jgi:hypothetical protein
MSFALSYEEAKRTSLAADKQIDGLEPGATSPVRTGKDTIDGGLPMMGKHEFSTDRTRHGWVGNQKGTRRHFPEEGATYPGK